MTDREKIEICKTALDFDAPMISNLADALEISKQEAEEFISKNLEAIFNN